jgi:HAD superfamily hydrolase (TIGR01509 family)
MSRCWQLPVAAAWLAVLVGCATTAREREVNFADSGDLRTASDQTGADKRARVRVELAGAYFGRGQTAIALDEVKLALVAKPDMPEALNLRGLIYASLGELQLAEESFRRALALCGYGGATDLLASELTRIYFENRFKVARPHEGAVTALRRLKGRCALGIISNGNTPLELVGIEDCFDHKIFAEEVGVAKPDPRIFEIGMALVPCRPEEFLYVGDSVDLDVMGAMNAGARTVWFNPHGEHYPDGLARPDFEITDLAELPEVVEKP